MMKSLLHALLVSVFLSVVSATDWESKAPVVDHVAFVRSIELAEPRFSVPAALQNRTLAKLGTPPDNKKEGYVVGGAISAFTGNVKGSAKQDILDATLFAQLAADKKYDREKDTVNWYSYYKYILGNIGFVVSSFEFEQYKAGGAKTYMDEVVIKILAAIATGNEIAVVTETLNALKGMSDADSRIVLFSQQSATSSSGSFQVYPVEQSPNGDVSMALGAFYFSATHHEVKFLFFGFGSTDTSIYKGAQKTVLNQNVYSKVRPDISSKLGDNAVNLVASIDLF